ncbi:MAG: hypothetical protein JWM58_661 [Rhizobium sp.]|nr:hypothetical protein [Rhizobium sp.]
MTIRSGIIVLIRCFSILTFIQLPAWAPAIINIGVDQLAPSSKLIIFAILAVVILLLVLIYAFAGVIFDMMTPKSNELYPEAGIRTDDLQAIAFSTLGAYVLYVAVRDTMAFLTIFQSSQQITFQNFHLTDYAIKPLASWIIGFYLLLGAPQIRRWIGRLRRAGPTAE